MILDTLDRASQYYPALPGLEQAVAAIRAFDKEHYPTGRTDVDGEHLFLLANAYAPRPLSEDSLMEAHRRYADIMYMVEGEETILVKPTQALSGLKQPYDPAGDALLVPVDDDCTAVCLKAGQFIVLLPQDAHCPALQSRASQVKKIICKLEL